MESEEISVDLGKVDATADRANGPAFRPTEDWGVGVGEEEEGTAMEEDGREVEEEEVEVDVEALVAAMDISMAAALTVESLMGITVAVFVLAADSGEGGAGGGAGGETAGGGPGGGTTGLSASDGMTPAEGAETVGGAGPEREGERRPAKEEGEGGEDRGGNGVENGVGRRGEEEETEGEGGSREVGEVRDGGRRAGKRWENESDDSLGRKGMAGKR